MIDGLYGIICGESLECFSSHSFHICILSREAGIAPLIILVGMLGSLQLLFIGLIGEYILSINHRVMGRPLVVEEERVGDWNEEKED